MTIDCGDWSYGVPKLRIARHDYQRKIQIGRYCSIGDEVQIFVGRQGRHAVDTLTTYPLAMAISPDLKKHDARHAHRHLFSPSRTSNMDDLDVRVGHDVWIGAKAMIMAGVTIGTGAVVAARAVVTKDVAPYAIVAGVPAQVKKYRHDPDGIAALLASEWWLLEPDEVWTRVGSLIDSTNVVGVAALLRGVDPAEDERLAM